MLYLLLILSSIPDCQNVHIYLKIRASQINGCAYCVNKHTRDVQKFEEKEERIYLINVWREPPNAFIEEEQLLPDTTEEITLIHAHAPPR